MDIKLAFKSQLNKGCRTLPPSEFLILVHGFPRSCNKNLLYYIKTKFSFSLEEVLHCYVGFIYVGSNHIIFSEENIFSAISDLVIISLKKREDIHQNFDAPSRS